MDRPDFDHRFIARLGYALSGIWVAFKKEGHLRFHSIAAICVFAFAFVLGLSRIDWVIVVLVVGLVIVAELFNTAIERVVDLVTLEKHPLAKEAKDIAAGAVLVTVIIAIVTGCIIFTKYIF